MRLPDDVFDEIVRHAGGTRLAFATGGDRAERRRESRRRLAATVEFTRYGSLVPDTRVAALKDLSPGGVGLVLADAVVAPGEMFVVHAPYGSGDRLDLLCAVRAVKVGRDGAFVVGAEFCSPDEPDVVDHVTRVRATVCGSIRMGDALPARGDRRALWGFTAGRDQLEPDSRRRRHERAMTRARGELSPWLADGSCGPAESVEVFDESAGGVAVLREEAMGPGEQFLIRLPREDGPPVTRFCAVTRVALSRDRHLLGARFVPFQRRHGVGWVTRLFDWVV